MQSATTATKEHTMKVQNMSKQQVRRMFAELGLLMYGRDHLLALKRCAEETSAEEVAWAQQRGATRREVMHEDYGSADQMRFCADVLLVFGPAGLTF